MTASALDELHSGRVIAVAAACALLGGAAAGVWVATGSPMVLLGLVALAGAGAMAVLAVMRFEYFLLGILGIRASLDVLKGGGPLEITSIIGIAFTVVAAVWLAVNFAKGRLVALSWASRGAIVFALALVFTLPFSSQLAISLKELARISAAIAMLLVLEQAVRSRQQALRVVVVMVASTVPVLTVALAQLAGIGGSFLVRDGFFRVSGTFLHPNPLAMYLVVVGLMVAAMLLDFKRHHMEYFLLAMVPPLYVLFSTYTRTAWIALAVGVLLILSLRDRGLVPWALGGLAAAVVLAPGVLERFSDLATTTDLSGNTANSLSWRAEYWGDALSLVRGVEGTGIGLGVVSAVTEIGKPPHNDFIRSYVEAGAIGLAGYVAFCAGMALHAWDLAKVRVVGLRGAIAAANVALVAAFGLFAITSNLISQVAVLWYVFAIMGLGQWVLRGDVEQAPPVELGSLVSGRAGARA